LRKTRAAKAKLKIQEFAEEKEDRDPQPLDPIQISRKADSRQICRSCEGDKPREQEEKSRHEELSSGYQPSGDRSSQGRENRDIESLEIPT
jgi:hypothetical protein